MFTSTNVIETEIDRDRWEEERKRELIAPEIIFNNIDFYEYEIFIRGVQLFNVFSRELCENIIKRLNKLISRSMYAVSCGNYV